MSIENTYAKNEDPKIPLLEEFCAKLFAAIPSPMANFQEFSQDFTQKLKDKINNDSQYSELENNRLQLKTSEITKRFLTNTQRRLEDSLSNTKE